MERYEYATTEWTDTRAPGCVPDPPPGKGWYVRHTDPVRQMRADGTTLVRVYWCRTFDEDARELTVELAAEQRISTLLQNATRAIQVAENLAGVFRDQQAEIGVLREEIAARRQA